MVCCVDTDDLLLLFFCRFGVWNTTEIDISDYGWMEQQRVYCGVCNVVCGLHTFLAPRQAA